MIEPDRVGSVRSFDDTRIAYQVFGDGPTVLVGNGIGVSYRGLALQVAHLSQHFRVVCWDHRGVFSSDPPGPGGVAMDAQARDAVAVLDHLGAGEVAYLGWSMGVQVGFEVLRLDPARVSRMVCIGGVAGSPFAAALPLPGASRLLPAAVRRARMASSLSGWLGPRLVRSLPVYQAARLVRFIRPAADRELFMSMAQGVASHDHDLYLETLAALGRHDATDMLPDVAIPLLFLVGSQDHLTPRRVLERQARRAPFGRLQVFEGASHFVTIERPAALHRALDDFLRPLSTDRP